MKTPPEDHDLIRWLDGEMSATELERFTARLETDSALKAEAEFMQRMCADVRSALPAEMPVPYGDFFNSQIQVRLTQETVGSSSVLTGERASWLDWFRLPSFVTAAAVAVAVVTAGVMIVRQPSEVGNSLVLSSYAPNGKVQVSSYQSAEAQATVLVLDGLEAIPADRKIVGYHIDRSEMNTEMAATTLYGSGGEVLVVSTDSRNQPRLLAAAMTR
ncbi:hypothetical protein SAMN02745166_00935 [Prosthecobacter debontii]|uniref:Uncharacterized protein n=1 Tax=Prosthecobacter debontii TaxID=48467 RepID=A0A1T4WZ35_9BACT|nr:hypothetical protein [Prosthecobacter debontii]SKA82610.1 hypothetical protein SAMN02745166_00935 [Prosthecobacter debontii]